MVAYIVCRSSYSFLGGSLMKCVPRKLFNPASSEGKRRDVSSKPFREDTLFFSPPKKVFLKSNFESLFFISIALKKKTGCFSDFIPFGSLHLPFLARSVPVDMVVFRLPPARQTLFGHLR